MGYMTSYSLKVVPDTVEDEAIAALRRSCEYARYAIDELGDTEESCKWYDWRKDISSFSMRYPNAVFEVTGRGEESGDIWRAYIKNGRSELQKARFVFDDPPTWVQESNNEEDV